MHIGSIDYSSMAFEVEDRYQQVQRHINENVIFGIRHSLSVPYMQIINPSVLARHVITRDTLRTSPQCVKLQLSPPPPVYTIPFSYENSMEMLYYENGIV